MKYKTITLTSDSIRELEDNINSHPHKEYRVISMFPFKVSGSQWFCACLQKEVKGLL
jgi:hypothetical protein